MATFISDNQKFHIFSKSPVRANMELFQATNKSGHTVISEEVRTDDIPWFINVPDVNNPPSYVKNPRKNDIIFQGKFNSLSTAAVCKKWDGEKWVDGPNLKDNPILKNKNDDDVIQVHFENDIEYVSDTNNAGTTSDKQAAFVLKTNGEMLTHFVSPTDKIYNGIPSNGYGLYLFLDNQLQSETDSNDSGYIANSYAGIIQFNKARSEGANKFKVITFEYIGGYLNKSLNKIEEDLKDYIDEEIKEHNEEFIAHKNNQNSEKHLSQSEVNSLKNLATTDKITAINVSSEHYDGAISLEKVLKCDTATTDGKEPNFKTADIILSLRDEVLQQSALPVTSKAIYNHVHKQSVDIEKASNNVTVEEVTTNENERRKYTIAVDGYTTSETDNIVDDIYEKIQATADDINKNVVEHTSNNEIHITDTERTSWNNNEVVLQKHLNDQNSHVSEADRILWDKGGNTNITGVNFIISEKTDTGWSLTLDNSLFENKVEALPSVYTGNNEAYINCYGFEYTDPSENITFDKIEIKFAKNLDTLTKLTIAGAPEISAGEVENNICKIVVAKVKTPTDAEIEIATSNYNTNISNEVNLSQFKFSKNIILEKGWNYRFYFYDKNGNLFAAPVIVNTLPIGDSLLPRNSVANRWLSERYDYWGAYNFKSTGLGVVANGLAVKLINAVQKHINDEDTHISSEERERWNNGSNLQISGDDFITPEKNDTDWSLTLNNSTDISSSNASNIDGNKTVPTVSAVKTYVDNTVDEHKKDTISTELSTWDIETTFTDGATNVFDFTCNSPFTGILTEVRLYCSPKTAVPGESYLEIRQNDKILARSTNAQYHSTYNLLEFNFDNILLKLGDRYGFYIVDKNGSKPSESCLALNLKTNVPEVANLDVKVSNYLNHTTRFGFTYYKSNREIISNTLNTLNSDLVYDISYKYSNLNNITNVTNRAITFADGSKIDFPVNKITHGRYAFRTKSDTTSPLTEFNLRIIDGGKPGSGYDSAYYYERDVRNNSYDEDVGGNLETLGNLINGDGMFIRSGITVFNDDLSCLIRARQMFTNSSLTTFRSALPSLTFADRMFLGTDLTEFKVKLPNLSSAECMFRLCENLKFVDTCFPNLTFAQGMFGLCNNLERVDLSASSGSNLYLADDMFAGCEKLKTVKINLGYLENAKNMFGPANNKVASLLDIESVKYIANTIKDWNNDYYTDRVHELALGIDLIHADYETSSYKQYIEQIADKNWKVTVYTSDSRNNPAFIVVK